MSGEVRPGDVVLLGRSASPEATGPVLVRLDRILTHVDGWARIDGHEVNQSGGVGARRQDYVLLAGLRPVPGRLGAQPESGSEPGFESGA
ncbi:MAG: hypothetical protein JXA67_18615 [Micromonosporaceae bacterium]|nr:hypothetical protein [Micromonosporaceae bacterium]